MYFHPMKDDLPLDERRKLKSVDFGLTKYLDFDDNTAKVKNHSRQSVYLNGRFCDIKFEY